MAAAAFAFRRTILAAAFCAIGLAPAAAGEITVFAAASLKTALDAIERGFEAATGNAMTVSYGGSSALARQIEQGAPADIFISANPQWMDVLAGEGLIDAESRFDLLGNVIVLVAHGAEAEPVDIEPGFDLAGMLGDGRLAMAMVEAVPAGIYGKAALTSLGVWEEVAPKVAQTDDVRAALALVSLGEAPYGIVYATDAVADETVSVVGTFPARSHPPIIYPAAAVTASDNPIAGELLAYLKGPEAREAFERQGFSVIGGSD